MKDIENKKLFQPYNLEYIFLHERMSYPFTFEQFITRPESSVTLLNELEDPKDAKEPKALGPSDLHSTYYGGRFKTLIQELGMFHNLKWKQHQEDGLVRIAHVFRERSVSYSIESDHVEDNSPLINPFKRSLSKLNFSRLIRTTFHRTKFKRGISRPVIQVQADAPPISINRHNINLNQKRRDSNQLFPNLSPIKKKPRKALKGDFGINDDSPILSSRSSEKDSNKSFVESEDEALFKETGEDQKSNFAPTVSKETEFPEKKKWEKKFYNNIVKMARDNGRQLQNKTRNSKRDSLHTLKIYTKNQLKRTATLKFLRPTNMEEKIPVTPVVPAKFGSEKKKARYIISKIQRQKIVGLSPEILLLQAIKRNQVKEVEAILSKYSGIALNKHSAEGLSLLHETVRTSNVILVELLLKAGADIDAQDNYGNTAAHYAKSYEYNTILDVLLSYGASENVINYLGKTVWEGASFPTK